jgi:hypothetical protein
MNTIPNNKKASGPRTKKEKTGLNKRSAGDPEQSGAEIKPKPDKAAEEGKEPKDTDMTQYQNIDSGKESSDTERPDNDIEGEDSGSENIFK